MKNKLKLLTVVLLVLFVSYGYSQSYINHDDFSITFNVEPKQSEADVPSDQGDPYKMYSYLTEEYNAVYMLSYIDYPQSYIDNYTTTSFFESAMSGFIGSLDISVVEQKDVTKSGFNGHYFKASGGQYNYYCIKYDYLVNNRFYQLGILRTDRFPSDYEISSFFDSFKLKTSASVNNKTNDNDEMPRPEPIPD